MISLLDTPLVFMLLLLSSFVSIVPVCEDAAVFVGLF